MIIAHVNSGEKATVSLVGTVLTIGEQVEIDIQARQTDTQQVIDICLDNQLETMREGLGAWYVANVIIPARQYVIAEDEQQARPIDVTQVEIRLWALPVKNTTVEVNENELNN